MTKTIKAVVSGLLIVYLIPSFGDFIMKPVIAEMLGISVTTLILISYPLSIWILYKLNEHNKVGFTIRRYMKKILG